MKHSDEIRQEAMRRVRNGEQQTRVAREMGLSHSIIGKWLMDTQTPTPLMDWFLYRKEAA